MSGWEISALVSFMTLLVCLVLMGGFAVVWLVDNDLGWAAMFFVILVSASVLVASLLNIPKG